MERVDFLYLLRLSEKDSAENSAAYRRKVACFAALGYAWVIGCLVLAGGVLYWALSALVQKHFRMVHFWALTAGASLLWASARALWVRLEAPTGVRLSAEESPALFQALGRIRKKIKGPPIHHVWLDGNFNASITQVPRYGLLGGAVNHLTVGLPLLMAIDQPRFLAVLAHEYGHLRGNHGTFAAWIYRTRLSWAKLEHSMRRDSGVMAAATQFFLNWYFPRFSAKTFALARQDEYEADRIAARLLGKEVTAAALTEMEIKGAWLAHEFWRDHWSAALDQPLPLGPYALMGAQLNRPPPEAFSRQALQDGLRRISGFDDTHPVLRDRLEALQGSQKLPEWSQHSALALLGPKASQWMGHLDKAWCKDNATSWKLHHAYLARVRARCQTLRASKNSNSADQMAELGHLQRRIAQRNNGARPYFEHALRLNPLHGQALRGLAMQLEPEEHALRMDCLNKLFDHSAPDRWWASRMAVIHLEKPDREGTRDTQALSLWRERLQRAGEAEERAWEALTDTDCFAAITHHDLNDFELAELQHDLTRCPAVRRAWLVRKTVKEFAYRRSYIVFIEVPNLPDEDRYALCRSLEQSLDLPGPALVLWAGHSPTLSDIEKHAFVPVFTR